MEIQPQSGEAPLYQRLGGYDAIAAVTGEFYSKLMSDSRLGRFFSGLSTDSKHRVVQLTAEMLCRAAGGPCFYTGRAMNTSHKGLGITEEDWKHSMQCLEETLAKHNVSGRDKDDVLSIIAGYKGEIIEPS